MNRAANNRRQAHMRRFLNDAEWFYPLREWPDYLQGIGTSLHRDNRERFTFFFFLTANGLAPDVAAEWVLMDDVINGNPVTWGYDEAAHKQVKQMVRDASAKTWKTRFVDDPNYTVTEKHLFFSGKKQMINMHTKRVEWM